MHINGSPRLNMKTLTSDLLLASHRFCVAFRLRRHSVTPMRRQPSFAMACAACAMLLQTFTSDAQPVTKIAAGYYHSVFLKSDGSVWTMGGNSGLWGDSANTTTNRPRQVLISGVTAIAAGSRYNLLLKNDGSLWVLGNGDCGQLGDGHYNSFSPSPMQIVASSVTAI